VATEIDTLDPDSANGYRKLMRPAAEERWGFAQHEAAHVVVGYELGERLKYAEIPRLGELGAAAITVWHPVADDPEAIKRRVTAIWAGPVSDGGVVGTFDGGKLEYARGLGIDVDALRPIAERILSRPHVRRRQVIVREALLRRGRVAGTELEQLFGGA
jgi:hypothetical protein